MDTSKMVKVTLAKVRTKGQHYWDKGGTEFVCSGGAVDYSVDGTWYWNRSGKGQYTRVFIEKYDSYGISTFKSGRPQEKCCRDKRN